MKRRLALIAAAATLLLAGCHYTDSAAESAGAGRTPLGMGGATQGRADEGKQNGATPEINTPRSGTGSQSGI